ncbi:MAG TPA: hypothetical protein DCW29_19145 [Janthinobacterium sp.]|nr:hypothetical protein [Janthinobacterium sp.]
MKHRFLATGSLLLSLTACGGGAGDPVAAPTPVVVAPPAVAVAPAPVVTPTVSGVSSNDVEAGGSLVVSGTNLDKVGSFQLAGVELKLLSVTPGTAVLTMPAAAASGTLTLVVGAATSATAYSLNVYLAPVLSGFAPLMGAPGSSVTISGSGLESVTSLRFANGIVAPVPTPHSGASFTFLVPAGAASGSLTLVAAHKEIVTGAAYTVVPAPTVTGLSSSTSGAYVNVVVTGSNLKTLKSAKVGSVDASVVSAIDTQAVLSVPLGSAGIVSLSFSYGADVNAGTVVADFTIGGVDFSEVYNRNINDAALRLTPGRPAAVRAAVLGVVPGQASSGVSVTATSAAGVVLGTLSMKGPLLLPMVKNEADLDSTFNAVLPGAWMKAGVRVRVDVLATGGTLSSQTIAPGVGSDAKIHIVLV